MKKARWSCMLLLALAAGCAPSIRWIREDIHPKAVRGDRRLDQVKIWSRDSVFQWRSVLITSDSISGIPATCDSCRRALALGAVDSLRVGYVTPPNLGEAASTVVFGYLLFVYIVANPNIK